MPNKMKLNLLHAAKAAFVLSVVLLHASGAQTNREQQEIRRLRAEFNRAIAAHDAAGLPKFWREDLHVTTGVGRHLTGSAAVRAAFETIFADPTFVAYTRTPDKIELSAASIRAAESGRWLGEWKKPDGKMEWGGTYLAMWRKENNQWRLQSELYVSLKCTGSRECSE